MAGRRSQGMGFAFPFLTFTFKIFGMAMVAGGIFPWNTGLGFAFKIMGLEPGGVFTTFAMETGEAFTF